MRPRHQRARRPQSPQASASRTTLRRKRRGRDSKAEPAAESVTLGDHIVDAAGMADGIYAGKLAEIRQHYRPIDTTREWAENNYYHLPIEQQNDQLIRINPFWIDFARHRGESGFNSSHFAHATNNYTEMLMALAVLDLPTKSANPKAEVCKE